MHISADSSAPVLAALLVWGAGERLWETAAAIAVHEAGHLAALFLCGAVPAELHFGWSGLKIRCSRLLSYGREAFCLAAGPGAGLLLALAGLLWGRGFWRRAGEVSAALTAFNLLPGEDLDGGALVRCALAGRLSPEREARLATLLTCAAALGMLLLPAALSLPERLLPAALFGGATLLFSVAKSIRMV